MRRSCTGVVIVTDELSVAGLLACPKAQQTAARANVKANLARDMVASQVTSVAGSTLVQAGAANSAANFGPYYPP